MVWPREEMHLGFPAIMMVHRQFLMFEVPPYQYVNKREKVLPVFFLKSKMIYENWLF